MATKTKQAKPEAPTVSVTVAKFDTMEPFSVVRDGPIGEFETLAPGDYSPRGGTPLLDATAKIVSHLDRARAKGTITIGLLLDESGSMEGNQQAVVQGVNEFVGGMADVDSPDPEAAGKVLCVIFTDGYENSSTEMTSDKLREMIDQRERDGWTFIYMGANQDAWATGRAMGLSGHATGQTINYHASERGTAAALGTLRETGVAYVDDNALYIKMASSGSISEDGEVTPENTAAPGSSVKLPPIVESTSPYDLGEALKKAKGEED